MIERQIELADEDDDNNWCPLPVEAHPAGTRPNKNLLGYQNLVRINTQGVNVLRQLRWEHNSILEERFQHSPEAVSIVNSTLQLLGGGVKAKIKIVRGIPQSMTSSVTTGVLVSPSQVHHTERVVNAAVDIYQPYMTSAQLTKQAAILGYKIERTEGAHGCCFTLNGQPPPLWLDHINDNYEMQRLFAPTRFVDAEQTRVLKYVNYGPRIDRSLLLNEWMYTKFKT